MTREELFEAIGGLDEALLDENVQQIEKKHHLRIFAAIAACAAVCIGAVTLLKLAAPPEELPHLGDAVPTEETAENTTESATESPTEGMTEFVGFLEGVKYYPLPEGSPADAVCRGAEWLSPELGRSAYFTFDEENGLYQVTDPLSSALPETGTFTQEGDIITAVSYDGTQSHVFTVLSDASRELTASTSWENLTGRVFTSKYDAENTLRFLSGVPYRQLADDSVNKDVYDDTCAPEGASMQICFDSGNYEITCEGFDWSESGTFIMEENYLYCTHGEDLHIFLIEDSDTLRLIHSTRADITKENFLDKRYTCRAYPEHPFGDGFAAEDVVRVHYFPKDEDVMLRLTPDTRIMEEFLACAKELVIYKEPVPSVTKDTVDISQMNFIIITLENSSMGLYIGDYVLLDDVGYLYDTASAQALNGFADRVLAGEFTNEEAVDVPIGDTGFTRPDLSMILPIPVTNEVGGITKELIFGRSQGTFRHMDQLSGSVEICYARKDSSITKGDFRFDFARDIYSSTSIFYDNDTLAQKNQVYKTGPRTVTVLDYTSDAYEDHVAVSSHDLVMRKEGSEDITLGQGANPTGAHELASCFFPIEMTYGYLFDFSRWELCGTAQYQGRECVVIQGKGGDYGARFEVENYTLWVDLETGMWLFLEGYDANGEVCQYIYTKDIRLNADALPPDTLTEEEFDELCRELPVYER